jgi:hypothetical protein
VDVLGPGVVLILILVSTATTGQHLTGQPVPGLLAAVELSTLALDAAGTAITAIIPSAQAAQPVLMHVYLPLILARRAGACPGMRSLRDAAREAAGEP